MNPLVTFEEAELEHLRAGMAATTDEVLQWLEDASEFSRMSRSMCFAEGAPVSDQDGNLYRSEEEYLGIPEWARRAG